MSSTSAARQNLGHGGVADPPEWIPSASMLVAATPPSLDSIEGRTLIDAQVNVILPGNATAFVGAHF